MVALESTQLFSGLLPSELQILQDATQEFNFQAGQQIFKEGDTGDGLYVVKSGLVQITAIVGGGERKTLSRVEPGEIFGEMAVLGSSSRSASASAEVDTQVYFIPRAQLISLFEKSPRLAASLVREISQRLRDFNRQYIQEVLQAERLALVGRFARSIIHDLKNPLNIIGIAAEMAGMDSATVDSRVAAKNRIRKQVDRINAMVNELLEFTRGSNTSTVLSLADYGTFIHQLVEEVRPEVSLKSAEIELAGEPPSVKVPLDPQRMSRVFYNLVHNACDAMPDGGKITLRFSTTEKEVTTEIEDSGKGIAPEIADQLFQAFATYGKSHGTGLGLSICKKIIEDHKGRIWARNSKNGGAVFAFSLPINS